MSHFLNYIMIYVSSLIVSYEVDFLKYTIIPLFILPTFKKNKEIKKIIKLLIKRKIKNYKINIEFDLMFPKIKI